MDRSHHNTYRKWELMGKPVADENVIKTLMKESLLYLLILLLWKKSHLK